MKKILRNILVLVVLLIVIALAARNLLIKSAVTRTIEKETGFGVELEGVRAGLLKPTFEVRGLRLINPEDFADATALEIDRFFVEYDLRSLLTDEIHLRRIIMDIPRVVVVQKEDGETNFQRLAERTREATGEDGKRKAEDGRREAEGGERKEEGGVASEEPPRPTAEAPKPEKKMRIDELTIKMGTAEIRKYTREDPKPKVKEYPINQERTYRNITDPQQIVAYITADVLAIQAQREIRKLAEKHGKDIDKAAEKLDRMSEGLGKSLKGLVKDLAGEKE